MNRVDTKIDVIQKIDVPPISEMEALKGTILLLENIAKDKIC